MITPDLRRAAHALDAARPVVARLDAARNPEDTAADIIEAWTSAESALRALIGGSPLSGQALIRELRAKELLNLEQGHALLGFLGARDRVVNTTYRPTGADVQAVREGFQRLEGAVMGGHAGEVAAAASAAAMPPYPPPPANADMAYSPTAHRRFPVLPIVLGTALLLALLAGGWWFWNEQRRGPRALRNGVAAYRAGRTDEARREFAAAARNNPDLAAPHVYLARMARDEGNLPGALSELTTAVRLEPNNGLALREMGAYLYTVGNWDLARKFYVRALQANPQDREAAGFLGCSLTKLGRPQEAQNWFRRAGQGVWSACLQQGPAMPPGMGPAGQYPAQPGYPQQLPPGYAPPQP